MIFVNNPGVSAGRIGRCTGRRTFGTLSRNAQPYESEDSPESDNFLLGCTVVSFGVAITLALVLLPLSICCSFLIYHPLFIFGVVLFFSLTLIGGILCVWHPVMTRCWWYKEDFCNRNSRQASYTSNHREGDLHVVTTNQPLNEEERPTKSLGTVHSEHRTVNHHEEDNPPYCCVVPATDPIKEDPSVQTFSEWNNPPEQQKDPSVV